MSTRTRPLALEGHSFEAGASQTSGRVSAVQAIVAGILREEGPATDTQIYAAYQRRSATDTSVPKASPSSVRSRRAELGRRGIVRSTTLPGRSPYGRPATVWALAETATEGLKLW